MFGIIVEHATRPGEEGVLFAIAYPFPFVIDWNQNRYLILRYNHVIEFTIISESLAIGIGLAILLETLSRYIHHRKLHNLDN